MQLRAFTMDDLDAVAKWFEDETFREENHWMEQVDFKEIKQWLETFVEQKQPDFERFGIEQDEQLIGYADMKITRQQKAQLGVAIGDSSLWGHGLGGEAILLLEEHAQTHHHINTFTAQIPETHQRARRMVERLGYREMKEVGYEDYLGEETRMMEYEKQA